MKKLLAVEIVVAVLFLGFLVVSVGMLTQGIRSMEAPGAGRGDADGVQQTLRIQMGDLQEDFSPLEYQGEAEENLLSLCFENLLSRDDSGRVTGVGQTSWKSGDVSLAHITSRQGQDGSAWITLSLNPNKKTAGGQRVTARDVLFNYYLRLDASSGLSGCFSGVEIAGAEAYTWGSRDISARKKEVEALLMSPTPALKSRIQNEIIKPELQREYLWVQGLYQDEKYQFITSKYTKPKDLFSYYYAYQTTYRSEKRTEAQVMGDICSQYGANYIALGKVTEKNYSEQAERIALGEILKQRGKDSVSSVEGIRMVDDYTVEIHVLSGENAIEKICDFWLLPLSVYGEEKKFDGKMQFGFQKGQAASVAALSRKKYQGTGPYYMTGKTEETLSLKKNDCYLKRVETSRLQIVRKNYGKQEDLVNALLTEKLDMAVVREDQSMERLLNNRGTGAAHKIKKIKMQSDTVEESVLYRTSFVNATTLPKKKQTIRGIFREFYKIKTNSTSGEQ